MRHDMEYFFATHKQAVLFTSKVVSASWNHPSLRICACARFASRSVARACMIVKARAVFDSVLPHDRGHGAVLPACADEILFDGLAVRVQANDALIEYTEDNLVVNCR